MTRSLRACNRANPKSPAHAPVCILLATKLHSATANLARQLATSTQAPVATPRTVQHPIHSVPAEHPCDSSPDFTRPPVKCNFNSLQTQTANTMLNIWEVRLPLSSFIVLFRLSMLLLLMFFRWFVCDLLQTCFLFLSASLFLLQLQHKRKMASRIQMYRVNVHRVATRPVPSPSPFHEAEDTR